MNLTAHFIKNACTQTTCNYPISQLNGKKCNLEDFKWFGMIVDARQTTMSISVTADLFEIHTHISHISRLRIAQYRGKKHPQCCAQKSLVDQRDQLRLARQKIYSSSDNHSVQLE